jgi:hypothetical protein
MQSVAGIYHINSGNYFTTIEIERGCVDHHIPHGCGFESMYNSLLKRVDIRELYRIHYRNIERCFIETVDNTVIKSTDDEIDNIYSGNLFPNLKRGESIEYDIEDNRLHINPVYLTCLNDNDLCKISKVLGVNLLIVSNVGPSILCVNKHVEDDIIAVGHKYFGDHFVPLKVVTFKNKLQLEHELSSAKALKSPKYSFKRAICF